MAQTRRREGEDLEIRELIRRATQGLSSDPRSVPIAPRRASSVSSNRDRYAELVREPDADAGPGLNAAALVLLILVVLLIVVPRTLQVQSGYGAVPSASEPAVHADQAFVSNVASFVHGDVGRPDGRFLVAAVRRPTAGDAQLFDQILAMRAAQKNAVAAASDCLGSRAATSHVTMSTEGFTGGSGGLMFALGLVDTLGRDNLIRGRDVAGTGTIAPDGTVGPVRYVGPKAAAAERAGADLFLVPAVQLAEAQGAVGSLRVVAIKTLDEAVRLLTSGSGCATS